MFTRTYSFANLILLLVFLSGLVSACSPVGSSISAHDQEHALLLQISSHVRLTGEPDLSSYVSNSPRTLKLASLRPLAAPATTTELDIVVDLYSTYLSRLQAGGNLTNSHVDKLATQLQRKIQNLNKRSEQLENRRGRRRRGLAGFFRRVGRSIGRFVRQLGRALGRAAEYLIEEVAPDVIRNMVLTGQPLNAKVFWSGVRKLVRTRLKTAIGTHLARRGVPMGVLAKAGLNVDMESEEGDEEDPPAVTKIKPAYGTWQMDAVGEPDDMGGYIKWDEYWTGLPSSFEDDCLVGPAGIHGATIFSDDAAFTFSFELDEETLHGKVTGSFDWESEAESSEGTFDEEITNGWVRPAPDGSGWEFGGTVDIDMDIDMSLRCLHRTMIEGGTNISYYWREQSNPLKAEATLSGEILQLVPGEGDEPDHLAPGGIMGVFVDIESETLEMAIYCIDCSVPDDFPPPVYLEE
jgi:hypothetical protein